MRCRRGEHISTVEGGATGGSESVLRVGEFKRPGRPADEADCRSEQPIVGADQHRHAIADLEGDRSAVGADARVDDGDDDTGAEVVRGASQGQAAGVEQIWIDPGVGFGKTLEHNLDLVANLDRFTSLAPVLLGFLGVDMVRVHDVRATVHAVGVIAR
ncbi:MAG: hypothetical protein EBZ17_10560 [Actinobacteria bacterium]|nr:hypothetical protein [Actinomycetota bacterium]